MFGRWSINMEIESMLNSYIKKSDKQENRLKNYYARRKNKVILWYIFELR